MLREEDPRRMDGGGRKVGRSESGADTSAASRLPGRVMDGEQQSFSIRVRAGLAMKMGGWTAARVRGESGWIFHRSRIEKSHKEVEPRGNGYELAWPVAAISREPCKHASEIARIFYALSEDRERERGRCRFPGVNTLSRYQKLEYTLSM